VKAILNSFGNAFAHGWPSISESIVVPAIERPTQRKGTPISKFIAKRGDVLIWHGGPHAPRIKAESPKHAAQGVDLSLFRGINHRADMQKRASDENGKQYALFGHPSWRRIIGKDDIADILNDRVRSERIGKIKVNSTRCARPGGHRSPVASSSRLLCDDSENF
jgi:hypothetical protein